MRRIFSAVQKHCPPEKLFATRHLLFAAFFGSAGASPSQIFRRKFLTPFGFKLAVGEKAMPEARTKWLQRGILLEYFTIGWNAVEALVAVGSGWLAGSIALIGFGLDSVIESVSGAILLWRLKRELVGVSKEQTEKAERNALLGVGITFWLLSGYVAYEAIGKLIAKEAPNVSIVGIVLATVSLIVMPVLAWGKRFVASRIQSRALEADAMETIVCAYLSFTLLLGLTLNAWLGWWWADPVASLLMLPVIVREGWEAIKEAKEEDFSAD
jgi:cation diffusion facilitator family transporter